MGLRGIVGGFILGLILDVLYVTTGLKGAQPEGYALVVFLFPFASAWAGNYYEEK